MEAVTEYKMKKGTVLATVNGFVGEEDFYRMHANRVGGGD